jgi:hypothetical protein
MGGVQRNWKKVDNYAKKGRFVGGVHEMTYDEREAMFSSLSVSAQHEDERVARIARLRAQRVAS